MRSAEVIGYSARLALQRAVQRVTVLSRDYSPKGRTIARKRLAVDGALDALARRSRERFDGNVLVDAMWDNPNYWVRYSLLRAALGLAHGNEVGVLGAFRQSWCRQTLNRFGIGEYELFAERSVTSDIKRAAAQLIARTASAGDIFDWKLPGDVHPAIVYDGILKRQRLAAVDIHHPLFESFVIEALASIDRGRRLLDSRRYDLVSITHPLNFTYGSLAWQALARGIPVVLPFGLFGVPRYTRFYQPADLFAFYDRPRRDEMDGLPESKADAMAAIGRVYLEGRFTGKANDLASVYAFQRSQGHIDRAGLCARFGWDQTKPIVAFYGSNWFDWPHQLGMTQFRDFLDWTEATFAAAVRNKEVNWLFKPHPCEDWFGGVTFADILQKLGGAPHIGLADKQWNNAQVMRAIDALVTYHGTAGVEFAALGKPVLLPDRGKYDDCGFAKLASSRAHYVELLGTRWWGDMDMSDCRRRAEIFAGWWFCAPEWQGSFLLPDDSSQDAIYDHLPDLIEGNLDVIAREIETIHGWWQSGHRYYHTSKMMLADAFRLSNVG